MATDRKGSGAQNAGDKRTRLIDDRELTGSSEDRFRHQDVVTQLADLVTTLPTPTSVALFGPWGSGKSSIYNLLDAELSDRQSNARLVRYDAFRYARLPLQRHFIRSLATSLDIGDKAFTDGLYEDTQKNALGLKATGDDDTEWSMLWRLLGMLAAVLTFTIVVALLLTAIAAATVIVLSDTKSMANFGDEYRDLLRAFALGFLAPAGLLVLVSGLATRGLTFVRQRSAPTSEEEFGGKFQKLVDKALKSRRYDRLVVFIDELDRCTPETVVETLDSLRTFLGANGCVFVVAADKIALEHALTQRVSSASPVNESNPYYSAGTEYLDKTFQYQLQLPPLLPRRLSAYAAGLVRGRPGVWSEVDSLERIVSVLVPNHVRSPRRVKALLNTFSLSYDLAERRAEAGHIGSDVRSRALELAFLTCLRVEFPLFARELGTHPDLIGAMRLELGIDETLGPFAEGVMKLARRYRRGDAPTDVLLTDGGPEQIDRDEDDESNEHQETDGNVGLSAYGRLSRSQARQLELYLRKTARVTIPRQDLIHLEGRGARFGIDAAIADALDEAGSQGDVDDVRDILDRLAESPTAGILALAESLDRDAAPLGEEASNLATVLLQIYGEYIDRVPSEDRAGVTGRCAGAIEAHAASYVLRDEDLAGALALGIDSGGLSGRSLARTVLGHEGAAEQPRVALVIVTRIDQALELVGDELGPIVGSALANGQLLEQLAKSLADAPLDAAHSVLEAAAPTAVRSLADRGSDEADVAEEDAAQARREAASALISQFAGLSPQRLDLVQRVASLILQSDTQQARDAVAPHLPEIVPSGSRIDYEPLLKDLFGAASHRRADAFAPWLRAIPGPEVLQSEEHQLDALATKAWKAHEDFLDDDCVATTGFEEALDQLARLLSEPLADESDALGSMVDDMLFTNASATAARDLVEHRHRLFFVDKGIVSANDLAAAMVSPLVQGLQVAVQPQQVTDGNLTNLYTDAAIWAVSHDAEATDLTSAALASPWLASPKKESLAISLAGLQSSRGITTSPPLTASNIASLVATHGHEFAQPAAMWVRWFAPDPTTANEILTGLIDTGARLEDATGRWVTDYASALDAEQLFALIEPELNAIVDRDPRIDFLGAAQFASVEAERLADKLVALYTSLTSNPQRQRLLQLWSSHGTRDPQARKQLLEGVLFPMLDLNAGSFDLALKANILWTDPPYGTKGELRSRIDSAAKKFDRQRAANSRMAEAGLKRRRRSLFGTTYEDTDSE